MAEFSEGRPSHPLFQQIERNLNWKDIKTHLVGGPKAWRHVFRQARMRVNPSFAAKEAVRDDDLQEANIREAGLTPLRWTVSEHGCQADILGCKLPTTLYQIVTPSEPPTNTTPQALPRGKWLELPATTTDYAEPLRYYNNGFGILHESGSWEQVTHPIQPFKGSINIIFEGNTGNSGHLSLSSPQETQSFLQNPALARQIYPHGGHVLGVSLFAEVHTGDTPDLRDAVDVLKSNNYFSTYNTQLPYLIQVGNDIYYIREFLRGAHGETAVGALKPLTSEKEYEFIYRFSANLPYSILFAMQTAAQLLKPGQTAKVAMLEENDTGRLSVKRTRDRTYTPYRPIIAGKL